MVGCRTIMAPALVAKLNSVLCWFAVAKMFAHRIGWEKNAQGEDLRYVQHAVQRWFYFLCVSQA